MEADEGFLEPDHPCPKQDQTSITVNVRRIYVFPDTQNFLHYKSFEQIDLPGLLGFESVVLVIAPIVLRELNDQSDSHKNPKIRKRAAAAIRKLGGWADVGGPARVRKGVSLVFQATEPVDVDFVAEQLDPQVNDDRLLASFIAHRNDNPTLKATLLTSDVGLRIKAQMRKFEIFRLPDDAKLPDDPDPQEAENKELRSKLQAYTNASPSLKLVFTSESSLLEVDIAEGVFLSPNEIQSLIKRESLRVPRFFVKTGTITSLELREGKYLEPKEAQRRNRLIDIYLRDYRKYLIASVEHENRQRRQFEVPLMLVNDGGKPADDVDIVLSFPEMINVFVRIRAVPQNPERPSAPEWNAQPVVSEVSKPDIPISAEDLDANSSRPRIVSDVSGKTVRFHVKKIKHHHRVALHSILCEFDAHESVRSFNLGYTLLADNIPTEVRGRLNIVVKSDEAAVEPA
jgi:hypothetical protein